MNDIAHKETDAIIAKIEKRVAKEYSQAHSQVTAKLKDYLRRFEAKDEVWRGWVASGERTVKEYKQWLFSQIMMGGRWEELKNNLATDYLNAERIADSIVQGYMPEVYAVNHNYATYRIEHQARLDTSYTLYNREAVERLLRDNPKLYKRPGADVQRQIADGTLKKWNKQQIQSVMMQGILQGESIPNLTKRLENVTGGLHSAAIRNARTMATGVQNAGRLDAIKRANEKGIKTKKTWVATLDDRTRHEHRELDGQTVNADEPFEVNGERIMFPGDPDADGSMVYNCFVGDTNIATDSDIVRSYKNEYHGDLIKIETASGINFTCTPNHPILTPSGWVNATLLHNGDNLVIASGQNARRFRRNGNIHHIHSTMKTFYNTLHGFGLVSRDSTLSVDFHGDVPATDVEVITKEWKLWRGRNSGGFNGIKKFLFIDTNKPLMRKSTFIKHLWRIGFSTLGVIGGTCKAFPLFCGRFGHSVIHRLRTVTGRNATLFQAKGNDMSCNMQILRQSLNGFAGQVFVDNIVNIKVMTNSHGFVYNLQTENGYYFVNSSIPQNGEMYNGNYAIAHNCRCTMNETVEGYEIDMTDMSLRNTDKLGDMSYEEWQEAHAKSQPITQQEEVGNAIRGEYIREYKHGRRK